MLGIILMLVIGGIIGWLASMAMRTHTRQGVAVNAAIGFVGALIGGFLLPPLLGGGSIPATAFDVRSLVLSFLGAVILLVLINLLYSGLAR